MRQEVDSVFGTRVARLTVVTWGLFVSSSMAANVTLTADDSFGTSSFNTAGRWSSHAAPTAGNDYFTGAHLLRSPATGAAYTFAGDSLRVDGGGRFLGKSTSPTLPGQVLTISNLILNGGYVDQANTPNYLTLAGGITVQAASSIGAYSTDTLEIRSVMSGSAPLRIPPGDQASVDTGVVKLSAANPFNGTVTVADEIPHSAQGLLQLNHLDALASATLNNINGTSYGVSFSASANTGTFHVGAVTGSGNLTLADTAGAAVTLSVGGNDASTTYAGALLGSGSLVKTGTGTLTLAGANNFRGDTTVAAGTLAVVAPYFSDDSTVSIAGGAILHLNYAGTNAVAALALDGVLQPDGAYDADHSSGAIAGTGVLLVQTPVPVVSPYRSTRPWQAYDGGTPPPASTYFDVPFMAVSDAPSPGSLRIAGSGQAAAIYYSAADAAVVGITAQALGDDIQRVTGLVPTVSTSSPTGAAAILIGTVGSSPLIDGLVAAGKIEVSAVEGKWEAYTAAVVDQPMAGVGKGLVIVGSDRRGTAFGVFGLSESMGVSPWYWWGDVAVPSQAALYVSGSHTQASPGVKYRGIFLNDEDWGLQPWAAQTFEPEVGNIGPKTYATIFELLLRLQANTIWPAMHEFPVETTPFYQVPGNKVVADAYAIVISTSHHEPMLRNSHEYDEGVLGPYNYWDNRANIYRFWEERVEETAGYENIYTIGMRGRTDAGMLAPPGTTIEQKAAKIQNEIIPDQRQMITDHVNGDPSEIPQIFIPYKETLLQYQAGLQLPDDVTILWPDDNHGYIRQLSTAAERTRSGGAGVYYHLSYWGVPRSYLWLCTTPPGMTRAEMMKAWDFGANQYWLVNVGDLKPAEIATEFFLRLARNPEAFRDFDQPAYFTQWATQTFDPGHADAIAAVLDDYYQLNIVKRPEHLDRNNSGFSLVDNGDEAQHRLDAFAALTDAANAIYDSLAADRNPAFYEMILYPIRASNHVNRRVLLAERSRLWANQQRAATATLAAEAQAAHDALLAEVQFYNQVNAAGKWNRMINPMSISSLPGWAQETQNPFIMPEVGNYAPPAPAALGVAVEGSASPLEAGTPGTLPVFSRPADPAYFIDVFNLGSDPMSWTAAAGTPWIVLSRTHGTADARILVRIDWDIAPRGYAVPGTVTIAGAGEQRTVNLRLFDPLDLDLQSLPDAVENNGAATIEAEDFTARVDRGDGTGWRRISRAAASGDGMTIQPVTVPSLDPASLPADTPSLTYTFHTFRTGTVKIRTQCLPTHRITSDHPGLRYAIALNGDAPRVVDINAPEYSDAWNANTLRAASIGVSSHEIAAPGPQTIQVWMVDAGVVLDRFTVEIASGVYEAEDLALHDSNTSVVTYADPPASEGVGLHVQSTAVGHYATLIFPDVNAGDYDLTVRVKKWGSRGIMQMAIAESAAGPFTDIGGPFDLYNPTELYTDLETLPVRFSSDGPKYLRCTATGKNMSASNYWILLDTLTLKPTLGSGVPSIETWRDAYFGTREDAGDAADLTDPDGDGLCNICEYSAGLYPTIKDPGVALVTPGLTNDQFSITFARVRDASDITYHVHATNDLLLGGTSIWSSATAPYPADAADRIPVTVVDPVAMHQSDYRFLLLLISRP